MKPVQTLTKGKPRGRDSWLLLHIKRPEEIRDEILGADKTINDAALAGVMGENYADEEAEDRIRQEQEEDLGGFRTPSNTVNPDQATA